MSLALTSPAFQHLGGIPRVQTCDAQAERVGLCASG